jgi:uncharacterized protein
MTANKRTVNKYMEAFGRSDHAQILSCLTDDIENEAFTGSPTITITRMTEENDVVVAEGSVRTHRRDGTLVNLQYCDVFVMQAGKIRQLVSYLMELK